MWGLERRRWVYIQSRLAVDLASVFALPRPPSPYYPTPPRSFSFRLQSVSGGAAAPAKKGGVEALVEKVWNEDTKLAAYVAIWYLGNIYCT